MSESLFFKRESKRSYLDKPVEDEKLKELFEIIRWSPSCSNNQPWRFIFVTDKHQHDRVVKGLSPGNEWMAAAPVLVVVCGREADDHSRDDNPVRYYQFDSGLATMSLLLGAVELGLMGHPTAGWDANKISAALEIPDEYHVMCVVALGYQGPTEQLTGKAREYDESPRERKSTKEIIARDKFSF